MGLIIVVISCFFLILLASSIAQSTVSRLSNESTDDHYRACIALDDSQGVHVAWKDKTDMLNAGEDWDVFYRYKAYNDSFQDTVLVSSMSVNESTCLSMDVDSAHTVHVAWKDNSDILDAGSDWDVFYARSNTNTGFSDPVLLSKNSAGVVSCPSVHVDDSDTVHIVWTDTVFVYNGRNVSGVCYLKKSINGNWSALEKITDNDALMATGVNLVSDEKERIHLVWYERNGSVDTYDARYSMKESGNEWIKPIVVSNGCTGQSVSPFIQTDRSNNVHVIWNDNTNFFENGNDYDVFYRMKPFHGDWQPIELVSEQSFGDCKWPSFFIDHRDVLFTAWSEKTIFADDTSDYDIVYTYKTMNSSWRKHILFTNQSIYESNWPRFVVDEDQRLHMTWWDRTPSQWITYYQVKSLDIDNNDTTINSTPLVFMSICFIITFLFCFIWIKMKRKNKR